ncbi:MAG: lytic transglycosylase domain-containing protein [Tabrizicola sp.]|nr:lytic transglycosylase domain-containing protein [Tabrizicola sp.]
MPGFLPRNPSRRLATAVAAAWIGASAAFGTESSLCLAAAQSAAANTGVPYEVLLTLTLVETGRAGNHGTEPWPWAINQGGEGHWFASQDEAKAFVESATQAGSTNIDLGCFQLNYRWHAENFASLDDMLDPETNALYAARLIAKLEAERGDWSLAAAAYHSRTPEFADRYQAKFDRVLADLQETPLLLAAAEAEPRENRFPLLMRGATGAKGSLVPTTKARQPLIGAP